MRHGRFIKTALVAVAAMAIGPATAMATPGSFTDDTSADFAAGSPGTATALVAPGSVQLQRTMKTEPFNGPGLPAGTTATPWPPANTGTGTVASGVLTVDGARVNGATMYQPGPVQILEFRATFPGAGTVTPEASQHVGFGNTLDDGPWAIFSTLAGGNGLSARTLATAGGTDNVTAITGLDATVPHTYRIEWSATDVKYYVDNAPAPVATHAVPVAGPMRPVVSDLTTGTTAVTVDSLGLTLYANSGAFESRVRDAGDSRTVWGALTSTVVGTDVTFETRSGNTTNPSDGTWSNYVPVVNGAIQSPGGRYIQYRATLSTTDDRITPSLDKVEINYDVDTSVPATPASGSGSGTTAVATPPQSGNSLVADKTAPHVSLVAKSLRASKKGTVSFSVGCPATEQSCKVIVKLKNGTTTVASKTVSVKGGKTKTVTLVLNKAARKVLGKRGSLKVSSVVTATDAAGNHRTTTKKVTLRRAAG